MSRILLSTAAVVLIAGATRLTSSSVPAPPSADCSVVGTWELSGLSLDGKAVASPRQQRKIVNGRHFMWISQDGRRDTLPLKTFADSLLYYRVSGGSGTYTTSGDSYVEHIDYFVDPTFIGKDWKATCRTAKDHWVHSYTQAGTNGSASTHVVEEWRRLD